MAVQQAVKRRKEPRKESELWQRLRAVRTHAGLTQLQITERINDRGLKIGRSAIALWESRDPKNRTKPPATHITAYAEICGAPIEFLLSDQYKEHELPGLLARRNADAATLAKAKPDEEQAQCEREARAFFAAVQHHVIAERGDLEHAFDVRLEVVGMPARRRSSTARPCARS